MKTYNITVNGKTYEVEVEEVNGNGQVRSAPKAQMAPKPSSAPKAAPAPKSKPKQAPPVASAGDIVSPMPGTVLELKVEEGQEVKAGEVVLILEAMKMENEITADADGKISKIYAPKGTSVNTGDALVGMK